MKLNIEKYKYKIDNIYIILFFLGIVGMYVGLVNMYFWLVLLFIRLIISKKTEVGIFCLLLGSSIFGRLFESPLLTIVIATVVPIIGFVILRREIIKVFIFRHVSYFFLSLVILFFVIYFFLSDQNPYAQGKIIRLVVRAYIWLTAFLILFEHKRVNVKEFTFFFLILSLFYLSQAYQVYNIRPSSFFDIAFFRDIIHVIGRNEAGTLAVNPHTLGYLSCGAIAFYISSKKTIYKNNTQFILLSLLSFFIILVSGARQTMLIYIAIYTIAFMLKKGRIEIKSIIAGLVIFIVLVFSMQFFADKSEHIGRMFSEENTTGEKLHRDIDTPFKVMEINPTFGIGFGEYPNYANKEYPHNFFLEILCEEGILGLAILSTIILIYILPIANKTNLFFYTTNSGIAPIIFLIVFFARGMISGDVSSSISFIVIIFCYRIRHYRFIPKKKVISGN